MTVCEYSVEEVEQLYQVREILERQAALMISLPVQTNAYERLKSVYEEHSAAIEHADMVRVVAANKRFHQELFRLCGNGFLADTIDEMAKRANLIRFSSSTSLTLLNRASREHLGILEALNGTDNEALARICLDHIQPSRRLYLEQRRAPD